MANRKKSYEQRTRPLSVTVPNVILDRIEDEMRRSGEDNLSRMVARVFQEWIDVCAEGKPLPDHHAAALDAESLGKELSRFSGFSSSHFV